MPDKKPDTPWLYDDFAPGEILSVQEFVLDAERIARWDAIFGWPDAGAHPSGPLVAMMMEAYLKAAQPRPPGNIHATQKLRFAGRRPDEGALVTATVACIAKEVRKERRWITFGVELAAAGETVLAGELGIIWAA